MEHQHTHEISRNFLKVDEGLSRIVPPAISAATGGVVLGATLGSWALVGGKVAAFIGAIAGYYSARQAHRAKQKNERPDEERN
jgi:uncharacterized membrane protein YdjX (TVP38/TMEM64 family)